MRKLTLIGIFALLPFVASADDAMPIDTADEVVIMETVEESVIETPDEVVVMEEVSIEEMPVESE